MYDCITIGDIKLDTFVEVKDAAVRNNALCLEYGKKIPAKVTAIMPAGSAPNVAVALARMKLKTAVFSVMGEDGTHLQAIEQMKSEQVDTRYIRTVTHTPSSAAIVINYKGEKTILASHEPFTYHLPALAKTKWVYVGELGRGYEKLFGQLITKIGSDHTHIGMNPGAHQVEEQKKKLYDLMKKTELLFLNVEEAARLTKLKPSISKKKLLSAAWKLNNKNVVVTDGRKGSYGFDGHTMVSLPMFPGPRVEATGAGDSFASGTLAATMRGLPLDEAMLWGAVNSASVVLHVGGQKGLLSAIEIKKRLKRHPSFKAKKI